MDLIPVVRTKGSKYTKEQLAEILIRRIVGGESLRSIGKDYSVSGERIRQIVAKQGRLMRKELYDYWLEDIDR